MRHRHIHAKRGEWVHVHRSHGGKGPEWLGTIIGIVILVIILKGCC